MLARGRIRIDHLAWDAAARTLEVGLTSGKDQSVELRMPTAESISADRGRPTRSPNAITLELPAGKPVTLRIRWN